MKIRILSASIMTTLTVILLTWGGPLRGVEVSKTGEYVLTDFGAVTTAKEAQATLDQACQWIVANGGGVLTIPATLAVPLEVRNSYQKDRESGPTVTIRDLRKGYIVEHAPAVGQHSPTGWFGSYLYRLINMAGHGLPFQGNHEVTGIRNAVVRGASSYMQLTSEAVTKGKDQRIYVPSIRGIFVGQYLTLPGKAWSYSPPFDRLWVKQIGWDAEKKLNYLVADLEYDHPAACILYNKHVTGSMNISSTANCDNQTMEFQVTRHQYSHGDSFLISSTYVYQGDVFSGLGDERGVGINSEVCQDPDAFHATIESVNWADHAIVIAPGVCNIQKLATSRGIINMNPKKWLTAGTIRIVPPENWGGFLVADHKQDIGKLIADGIDLKNFPLTITLDGKPKTALTDFAGQPVPELKYTYQGRAYPSLITGGVNYLGGCIIGSADCGWTPDVIGRFFAVADPGEYLEPGEKTSGGFYQGALVRKTYRWYLIKQFRKNADNSCVIKIERIRWAAVDAGAPNLYNFDNYTWDGHERPMPYIIAPGAFAYDVGDAWKDTVSGDVSKSDPRTLRVVPNGDRGTAFDFAAGDLIEQAIGADPAVPTPYRVRVFNGVPNTVDNAGFHLANHGKIAMDTGIDISGDFNNREQLVERKDRKAAWINGVNLGTVTENGINFGGDVTHAALYFRQPNEHEQPIKWKHAKGETSLTVDPVTGDMAITGSTLTVSAAKQLQGVSATATAANNLRGLNVPVPAGAKELLVTFATPEADASYSLNVQPNWLTQDAVAEKNATGFKVLFSTPAAADAKLDWQLIR